MRGRWVSALAALLIVGGWGGASPARADEYDEVALDRREGLALSRRVHVRVLATPAGNRPWGYGYSLFEFVNPTDKAHEIQVHIVPSSSWRGHACRFTKTVRLEPGATPNLTIPLLNAQWGMTARFRFDGTDVQRTLPLMSRSGSHREAMAVALVGRPTDDQPWVKFFDAELGKHARHGARTVAAARTPAQLPDRWTLLSGFDCIVADLHAPGWTSHREDLLLRYVRGGGNLVVHGLGQRRDGPLTKALRWAPDGPPVTSGFLGLGRWIAAREAFVLPEPNLQTWLAKKPTRRGSLLQRVGHPIAGPLPMALYDRLAIPGLGEVPTGTFVTLIVLFALLVGPASYLYFRRRKHLARLLWTVPLAGFLCTAAILAYGFFSEGFGITGTLRSFTVLDQETQTASTAAGRMLYAGLQPRALEPGAGSVLVAPDHSVELTRSAARFDVDLDAGFRVGGGALLSRTPTPFATTTVGRSRERLRFRRRTDGGYDVLAAPGMAPVQAKGAVILRTADGGTYVSVEAGHLVAMNPDRVRLAVKELVEPMTSLPLGVSADWDTGLPGTPFMFRVSARGTPQPMSPWLQARVGDLPPGSYVARVTHPPLFDDLGLDVAWRAREHVVLGLLGPEDVKDE